MGKTWQANRVYLLICGASSLFFTLVFTVNMIYQAQIVGLNPLQLVLVGTVLEISALFFEIPTGVVADVYSRRLSVIIGMFLIGAGFIIEGVPTFSMVLLSQVVWGIGSTFISGAQDAWIADEIGNESATPLYIRGSQVGQFVSIIAIIFSVGLGSLSLQLPIVLGGIGFILLGITLIFIMPEDGFSPVPRQERTSWRDLFQTLGEGIRLIRSQRVLVMILLISLGYGLYSESFDRLWTPHLLSFNFPLAAQIPEVFWFGGISIVLSVLGIIAAEIIRRRVNMGHSHTLAGLLGLLYGLTALGSIAFALAGSFWVAVIFYLVTATARAAAGPLFPAWLNQHTESSVRATVHSIAAQANAFGQIVIGPAIGTIGLVTGLRTALTIGGIALLPVVWLITRTRRIYNPKRADVVTTP